MEGGKRRKRKEWGHERKMERHEVRKRRKEGKENSGKGREKEGERQREKSRKKAKEKRTCEAGREVREERREGGGARESRIRRITCILDNGVGIQTSTEHISSSAFQSEESFESPKKALLCGLCIHFHIQGSIYAEA